MNSSNPDWTSSGEGFVKDGPFGTGFYGVGTAQNIDNITLRRSQADASARASLARVFKSKVKDLNETYLRAVGNGDKTQNEQFAQQTTKVFTDMDLAGAAIVGRSYDKDTKTEFSCAILDVNNFKKVIESLSGLSADTKDLILKNADEAFKKLDAQK